QRAHRRTPRADEDAEVIAEVRAPRPGDDGVRRPLGEAAEARAGQHRFPREDVGAAGGRDRGPEDTVVAGEYELTQLADDDDAVDRPRVRRVPIRTPDGDVAPVEEGRGLGGIRLGQRRPAGVDVLRGVDTLREAGDVRGGGGPDTGRGPAR